MLIAKLLLVFGSIVWLLRKKHNMGAVMTAATLMVALLFQLNPGQVWAGSRTALLSPATLKVTLALLLVMVLENTMRRNGLLQGMVESLQVLVPDRRVVMGLLPAIIGFLPSPGGAVFSAPLVAKVGQGTGVSAERQAFINHYYRHVWEYFLPLYPGILLAAEILRLPLNELIRHMALFWAVVVLLGWPVGFYGVKADLRDKPGSAGRISYLTKLIEGVAPIATVVIAVLGWGANLPAALGVVIIALWLIYRYSLFRIGAILIDAFSPGMILMVVGVMVFNEMLIQAGVIGELPGLMAQWDLPVALIAVVLPLAIGLTTGVNQGVVAATFPLLAAIPGGTELTLVALAFVSGMAGVMLSPVHLCLGLTVQVFRANFGQVLMLLAGPQLILIGLAWGLYLIR